MGTDTLLKRTLLVIAIITFLLSLPLYFARGIGTVDDSNFLVIGKWMEYGFKPYNDIMEIKPPAIYYTSYMLQKFFGEAWWVHRIFIALVNVLFAVCVGIVTTRQNGWLAGTSAGLFTYPTLMVYQGYTLYPEQFCALFGIIALGVIYGNKTHVRMRSFIFGLLVGVSSLFKQPGVLYLLAYLCYLAFSQQSKDRPYATKVALSSVAVGGFVCVWIPTILLLHQGGMLDGFITCAVMRPLTGARSPFYVFRIPQVFMTPAPIVGIGILVSAALRKDRLRGYFRRSDLLLLFMFLFSLVPLLKRPTPHYMIPVLFPATMLLAKTWCALLKNVFAADRFFLARHMMRWRLLTAFFLLVPIMPPLAATCYGDYFFIREKRIAFDCRQAHELGNIVNQYMPDPHQPLLIAPDAVSRIYYMLERRPLAKDFLMLLEDTERPERLRAMVDLIEQETVPVVILREYMDETQFKGVDIGEFRRALQKGYRRVPLRFGVDTSRRKWVELYVLKRLAPRAGIFRSNVFPKGCAE